jgi:hypothetical protein
MCVRVAMRLVTEQGQSRYRKLQRQVSPAGVFLNYYVKYCIRYYGAYIINLIICFCFIINMERLQSIRHSNCSCIWSISVISSIEQMEYLLPNKCY